MTPRRAAALAVNLPPGSVTWIEADMSAAWTIAEHLAAAQIDALAIANWQRTKDGTKGQKKPKPIPRPGEGKGAGGDGRDPDRIDRQIAAFRARQKARQEQLAKEG